MAVSSVETGPRVFMDPDNKDITSEQLRRHLIDERKRLFHDSRGVKIPVNDLTDQEYSEVTGYNITEKPEVVPSPTQASHSKSALERVRDFLLHFPKPNTPQRNPV